MAEKGPGSTKRSASKRLARAKIKPTENGIKSSKGRAATFAEVSEAERKRARKQKITGIAIGAFAVIMALSMMLPSLTYIFGTNEQPAEEQAQQTTESDDADADDETQEEALTGIDAVDANYKAVVDPLEAKLSETPEDLATLLSLGNNYTNWGSEASSYATDDDGTAHANELFEKAVSYFDKYLELNDSVVVKASRAMCFLYQGDTDKALESLIALTEEAPDYGPAWANMGLIYEYKGESDKAKDAYQKAVDADANDEYGAKSYANRRLAAMAAQTGDGLTDETAESAESTPTSTSTGAKALEDALGVGL